MDVGLIGLTLVWFFLLLSFLVFIHEFGHFLAAKLIGTHVEEFGLGYPPRVRALFTKWHTVFSLNAMPFGGFVRIWGDDAEQLQEGSNTPDSHKKSQEKSQQAGGAVSNPPPPGAIPFSEQPKWKRLIVILAGVFVNFAFGCVAFAIIYSSTGIPERTGNVTITEIVQDSPAAAVGLQPGDEVLALQTPEYSRTTILHTVELTERVKLAAGQEITLFIVRNGEEQSIAVTPRTEAETPENQGSLGVALEPNVEFHFYPWYEMPFRGVWVGVRDAFDFSGLVLQALGDTVSRIFMKGEIPKDLAGPVGIVDQAVQAEVIHQGIIGTLNWAGVLSINLAVMNLLPIPALDGGRAVFIVLEAVIGKARRLRWERLVNSYSFLFLIGLILLITLKDVLNILL